MLDNQLLQLDERRLLFGHQPQQLGNIEREPCGRACPVWPYGWRVRALRSSPSPVDRGFLQSDERHPPNAGGVLVRTEVGSLAPVRKTADMTDIREETDSSRRC